MIGRYGWHSHVGELVNGLLLTPTKLSQGYHLEVLDDDILIEGEPSGYPMLDSSKVVVREVLGIGRQVEPVVQVSYVDANC